MIDKLKIFVKCLLWRLGLRRALPGAVINAISVIESGEKLEKHGEFLVRRTVSDMLVVAQKNLPNGVYIKILSGYRSLDEQWELWNDNPDSGLIANPANGGGGHQTGGAVDVTLADADGRELYMASGYSEFNGKNQTEAVQNPNRKMLNRAMTAAGFVNYPNEWWHYSYGDRMWAAYAGKRNAIYGPV